MFFRRHRPKPPTFEERLENLRAAGFTLQADGALVKVLRSGFGAYIEDVPSDHARVYHTGLLVGNEIGILVDGGYQKFFRTPTGKKLASTADHLRTLHDFEEDLREGLGLISLYNEALGTVCGQHLYDRVEHRDHGVPRRPWEVRPQQ